MYIMHHVAVYTEQWLGYSFTAAGMCYYSAEVCTDAPSATGQANERVCHAFTFTHLQL